MKKEIIFLLLIGTFTLYATTNETNSSEGNQTIPTENNHSKIEELQNNLNTTQATKVEKQLQEQIKKEEKYAKEQTFYQGSDYNLSASEVDKSSLDNIELPEPDYDFDMNDVYD